jgi:hypothetical protein
VLVWVVGIVVSLGFAVVIAGLQARSGPASAFEGGRRVGEVVGEVLAAFLVAFGLWALVVWVSRRRGRARRLTSPIVPLIAIVFLGLAFTNVVTRPESAAALRAAAGTTHTLDQVLVIDPPYRLDTAPPEEERQFLDLFTGSQPGAFKTVVMRRIYEGEDLVGYAIVADAEVKPGAEAVAMGGVELGLGGQDVTKTHTTLAGHDVISGTAGGAGYTVWVEAPFVKIVFAPVESDAATIAERFISD